MAQFFDSSRRDQWRAYFRQLEGNRHFFLAFTLFRPRSKGTVRLASTNPFEHPLIDPQYFSVKQDLVAIVRAMSIGLKIAESPYFAPYASYSKLPVPGCESDFCPDRPLSECYKYLACCVQTYTLSTFHPVGTSRMGNSTNPEAVVDERLRVRNVARLRVIDASIMPTVNNANTNAATMMIGEKGAHMVAQDNGLAN